MNFPVRINCGKAIMPKSLWLCFMLLLTVASIKAEALNSSEPGVGKLGSYCPLNISAELVAHPWMVQQCSGSDKSHCCEGIDDLIQILRFSWMHTTRSFLLPTNRTAAICLNEFQRQMEVGAGIGADFFNSCNARYENFIWDSGTCLGIDNLNTFESRVDSSGMKLNCNGSGAGLFQCNKCLRAMATALHSLTKGSGGKSNCPLFVIIYVGGGINSYDGLGPDAAYCLLSLQNTTALSMKGGKKITKTYFLAAIPVLVMLVVLTTIYLYIKRRKSRLWKSNQMKLMQRYELLSSSTGLTFFSLSEIRDSTGNFAASNVIGQGGFSTVYLGTLPDGSRTAVKRLKNSTKINGQADFLHELHVIAGIKHRNLLPLRGYCVEFDKDGQVSEQLLVSDFMENGSLADCLFNQNKSICLSWPQRYKIGVGIARGISYLHEFAKPAIIHRDVKAANVLLDGHFNALVADFGLAKFKKEEEENSHFSTRTVGTVGYVAPEYALYGHLTNKSDVFSFGIILLELITGRRALDSTSGVLKHFLISDWVVDMMQMNRAEDAVIDMRIRDSGYRKTIDKVLLIALQCSHPNVDSRPSISEALLSLEAIEWPLSGTKEIESELEASCNNRGEFSWFLSPGRLMDESTSTDRSNFSGVAKS